MDNKPDDIQQEFSGLAASEDALATEVAKIEENIRIYSKIAWLFIGIGFIAGAIGIYYFIIHRESFTLNELGDYLGGTVASFWSLAGLLLIYVVFLGQKQQLLNQKPEIKLNQLELRATRGELKGQKDQMIEQTNNAKLQNFENTFFHLLSFHHQIVTSFDTTVRRHGAETTIKGRGCFDIFYDKLEIEIRHVRYTQESRQTIFPESASLGDTLSAYTKVFKVNQSDYGHYFRNLYHIFKFIDGSQVEYKQRYASLVRAQLSSHELVLLFYNCLHENGKEKFQPLIERYAILKNMDWSLVFNQEHIREYSKSAYGIEA